MGVAPNAANPMAATTSAPHGPVVTSRAPDSTAVASRDHDAAIDALAVRQHGAVTRAQLLHAGVPAHAIDHRVKKRRLRRLFRGVYGVGPISVPHQRHAAAVLACGETAVLSHRSAAAVWKLLPHRPGDVPVEVSIQRGYRSPGSVVRVYQTSALSADERTVLEGIPITTPARTLLDIASTVTIGKLEAALARASRRGFTGAEEVWELLNRYPRRRGAPRLRELLAHGNGAPTRSEAEARFLTLVRRAQLPRPHVNVAVEGYEVDFLWRRQRFVVEIDGFRFHSSAGAFERDRRRDAVLAAAGFRVVRVTWRQLTEEPEALLVRLAQVLVRTDRG